MKTTHSGGGRHRLAQHRAPENEALDSDYRNNSAPDQDKQLFQRAHALLQKAGASGWVVGRAAGRALGMDIPNREGQPVFVLVSSSDAAALSNHRSESGSTIDLSELLDSVEFVTRHNGVTVEGKNGGLLIPSVTSSSKGRNELRIFWAGVSQITNGKPSHPGLNFIENLDVLLATEVAGLGFDELGLVAGDGELLNAVARHASTTQISSVQIFPLYPADHAQHMMERFMASATPVSTKSLGPEAPGL